MKLEDSEKGLFRCDECGATITPFGILICEDEKHYCSLECYEKSNRQ